MSIFEVIFHYRKFIYLPSLLILNGLTIVEKNPIKKLFLLLLVPFLLRLAMDTDFNIFHRSKALKICRNVKKGKIQLPNGTNK